jgi:hypothetical protein
MQFQQLPGVPAMQRHGGGFEVLQFVVDQCRMDTDSTFPAVQIGLPS